MYLKPTHIAKIKERFHRLTCRSCIVNYVDAFLKPHGADKVSRCVSDGLASSGSELTCGVCADSIPSARTELSRRMIRTRCDWWRASVTPVGLRMCKIYTGCKSRPPSPDKVSSDAAVSQSQIRHCKELTASWYAAADDASQVASLSETLRSSARA